MRVVVFGLTVSSAWGNGHATLWRSLIRAMLRRGYEVIFFEKDVPYYSSHRDLTELGAGGLLRFYEDFEDIRAEAVAAMRGADVAVCTSFCPDGRAACAVVTDQKGRVEEILVKSAEVKTEWIWGGIRMPGHVLAELHALWQRPGRGDEYLGTLVSAWLGLGNEAWGVRGGEGYVDVGTLNGYRKAVALLAAAGEAR